MFWPDALSLKQFYHVPLGREVERGIARQLSEWWPPARDETTLGIGYAVPFLDVQDAGIFMAMPPAQGAHYWPSGRPNRVFLAREGELPLPDNLFNRVLAVHALENSQDLEAMLQELWRVLTPGGRMMCVVPNRRGAWTHSTASPFGHGQPFSAPQLRHVLMRAQFTVLRAATLFLMPPTGSEGLLRLMPVFECLRRWFFPGFGGVLVMEAEKQLYANVQGGGARHHARQRLPSGAIQPAAIRAGGA